MFYKLHGLNTNIVDFTLLQLFQLLVELQFSSVQFSFISAPPHEQNNKMLKSLCVVKDGVRKRKKQQNELTLCLAN